MKRYFIYLSYDGSKYHGWQIQPNGISVQEVLEKSLTTLLGKQTSVTAAGRTDAGVNASSMPVHFDTDEELPMPNKKHPGETPEQHLAYKLNRILP